MVGAMSGLLSDSGTGFNLVSNLVYMSDWPVSSPEKFNKVSISLVCYIALPKARTDQYSSRPSSRRDNKQWRQEHVGQTAADGWGCLNWRQIFLAASGKERKKKKLVFIVGITKMN